MTIVLNGERREAPGGISVLALLETIGLSPGRVAVEINGRVTRRGEFAGALLREDDRVEVVQFVGGG
ncbi:MAG TPA: sulfur carrier protein ThiS [Candidatus Polarisedimenticolia bacterium]|jgi:sulfur carrier protein|nr:sulfur carrier protein ThiS [Candidatus Polarisedimenticolia bacterium]